MTNQVQKTKISILNLLRFTIVKLKHIFILSFLISGIFYTGSLNTFAHQTQISIFDNVSLDEVKGLVIIDDIHNNDYTPDDLGKAIDSLRDQGYLSHLASRFSSWSKALEHAHYLVMTATKDTIPKADISEIYNWFNSGSRNLIMASRGDYEPIIFDSMNSVLANLTATVRIQDDNVYTTDPAANRAWHVDTSNFNSAYSELFVGVNNINFFSLSSIYSTATSDVLIYAESQAYQTDQNEPAPSVIFDDTDDGVGGDTIPLAVIEEVTVGSDVDRIIVVGTTLWSNFDYGDSDADDTIFFQNTLNYMKDKTIASTGDIVNTLPDIDPPSAKISYPHDNANLKGTVEITVEAKDPSGIATTEIYISDELVSSTSTYSWDTTLNTDGTYKVKAVVTDTVGNTVTVIHTYTIDQTFEPAINENFKIMTYNIKESGIYPEWMDVMKEENADLIMLVETGDFDDSSNALLTQYLTTLNEYFFDEIAYEGYTLQEIDSSWNGITLLSRLPISNSQKVDNVKLDDGSNLFVALPFLHAELDVNGQPLHVVGAHLTCCSGNEDDRIKQMEGILNFMDGLGNVPLIYLGDMNSESPDDTTSTASSLGVEPIDIVLNPNNAKASMVHTFTDVQVKLNPNTDGFTYGGYSRIDYIFTNQAFDGKLVSSTTGDTDSADGASDHVSIDVIVKILDITFLGGAASSASEEEPAPGFNFIIAVFSLIPILSFKRKKN